MLVDEFLSIHFLLLFWVLSCGCSMLDGIGTRWQKYPTPPWVSRAGFAALRFNNSIFVFGGENGPNLFNDIWISSDLQTWTNCVLSVPQWSPRVNFAYLVFEVIVSLRILTDRPYEAGSRQCHLCHSWRFCGQYHRTRRVEEQFCRHCVL